MKLPWISRKENPAYRGILIYHPSGVAVWTGKDFAALSREGYENCATVFSCVKMIATAGSRIDWYMSKLGLNRLWKEFDTHEALDRLAKPNEYEGGIRFMEKLISFILLNGNSYIWKLQGARTFPPNALYMMRPDRMKIIASSDWKNPILRYDYSIGGTAPEPLRAEDVLHITEFAPLDDFYGLSRISVAAHHVDISNEANRWNFANLKSDMRPPGIVTGKGIKKEDIDLFKKMFNENYQDASTKREPLVLAGEDIKYTLLSLTPKDVEWLNGQKHTKREICSVFNMWSGLLNDHENTTYNNQREGRKAFYLEAVLPIMDIVREELNNWFIPLYGDRLRLDYDRDSIEALQEEREKKYVYLAAADWLMVNEKRVACGYEEIPNGDVVLTSFSNIPLEQISQTVYINPDLKARGKGKIKSKVKALLSSFGIRRKSKEAFWRGENQRKALWRNFEQRVRVRERSFQIIARGYLARQWADIKAKLDDLTTLAGVNPETLFDAKAETEQYVKIFAAWYRDHFIRAGNAGMQAAKGELFNDAEFKAGTFVLTPEQEAKLRDMIFNSGTEVNKTTITVIYEQLLEAQATDMTVEEFTQEIWRDVASFDPWRARLWARTETTKVDNFGTDEGYKETEFVDMKGWLCSMLPNSRPEHVDADGDEVNLDEKFLVGGELLDYPGDPAGSAGNVCNCLCTTYPVVGPGTGE